jgi:LL-diaminopimelate aminotransferase
MDPRPQTQQPLRFSERLDRLPAYAVGAIAERKRQLLASGMDIIDLGAGDADLPPPPLAVEALHRAALDPKSSRYGFQIGSVTFREAAARFMERRFGVRVDAMTELLPLIGSKEGLAHLPLAAVNPGDVCIVPEPGYPAYAGGVILAQGEMVVAPLRAEDNFLVELERIPEDQLSRTRIVFLNYPNNPTGAVAPREYLERIVRVCRERSILLAYDNPYSELTFDGYQAPSILEIPGARDIAVEFHSVSKTFCMTGWRLGWVVGNSHAVKALSKVKSYVDTGAFLAVQEAGARVLDRCEELVAPVRETFRERRDALVTALRDVGCECAVPRATMYLWVPLPAGVASGPFAAELLERDGVAVLAGSAFGKSGEGYIRMSFIVGRDRLREAAVRFGRALERTSVARVRA